MPSEPSNFNQKNPSSKEGLNESTTFQYGNRPGNHATPEVSLEQRNFKKDATEKTEEPRDIGVYKASTTRSNNSDGEPDGLRQVSDDGKGSSQEQQSYLELYGSPIISIPESALGKPSGVSALPKCNAIEKLPNGIKLDSYG